MKLAKYQKNKQKIRITVVLVFCGAMILGVLLEKSYASYQQHQNLELMNGNVEYFGNSDVYFAFYNGNQKLETMPHKSNSLNLSFSYGECNHGAKILWNEEQWAPMVLDLTQSKTACSLYFAVEKTKLLGQEVTVVLSNDGLYKVFHSDTALNREWEQVELRYAGVNPNNYVQFNDELWRIIGLVNVKNSSGELVQRVKLVRDKSIDDYFWNNGQNNNWLNNSIKNMLNGIYYKSQSGTCYSALTASQCDFSSSGTVRGLNALAQSMIDSDVTWNIGGMTSKPAIRETYYDIERGIKTYNGQAYEWTKENDSTYHNGIGLLYPSESHPKIYKL